MSAIAKRTYTEAEFLEFERASSERHQYFDGAIFAMAGASHQHNEITLNLSSEILNLLRGCPCRPYSLDMRVKVQRTGLLTYPDVLIVCGEPEFLERERPDTLLNPQVIFEVLSPSTQDWDRDLKFQHYQKIPSMREYVLVSQDKVMIDHHVKLDEDCWERDVIFDENEDLVLPSVPLRIRIADIYRGVTLTNPMKRD